MSNPDIEILKADIEHLLDLIDEHGDAIMDNSIHAWMEQVSEVSARIRRILAQPTDSTSLQQTRSMNKDPKSTRED